MTTTRNILRRHPPTREAITITSIRIVAPVISLAAILGLASCAFNKETPPQSLPTAKSTMQNSTAAKPTSPIVPGQSLQELVVREEQGQTILRVKFVQSVTQYRHFQLPQPSRIVLDILDEVKAAVSGDTYRIDTNWISTLRMSANEGSPLRLVVEIAAATVPPYTISPEDGGLKIVVGSQDPNSGIKRGFTLVKDGKRVEIRTAHSIAEARPDAVVGDRTRTLDRQFAGPKVSLKFTNPVEIRTIFQALMTQISGKNIIVTDDVNRKVSIELNEVPWEQAMDLLINTNGLAKEEIGNVIRISTEARLKGERDQRLATEKAKENLEPLQTIFYNVNYAKAKDLEGKIKLLMSKRLDNALVVDDRSNTIMVRDIQTSVDDVTALVGKLDTRTPQVLIESNLIETNPTFARALGTKFNFTRGGATITSDFTPSSGTAAAGVAPIISVFQNRFGGLTDLNATLTAAENEGLVKVISRPSVATLNNVESTIQSLRILRIALPSSTNIASGSGSAAGTAVATEKIPTGITLTVTPQVSSDGFILMRIGVKSSSVAPTASPSSGTAAAGVVPFDEISREAIANVLVRDGETIVVGGILKDSNTTNESGIPWIKDVPVLGWLFKNNTWQKQFEEMMVFITPRIASAGSANLPTAEQLWREQMKKTDGSQAAGSQSVP
jgi:type II secretory pathway component GspD/PulD (secretin)